MRTVVIDDDTLEIIIDDNNEYIPVMWNVVHSEILKGQYAKYWVKRK